MNNNDNLNKNEISYVYDFDQKIEKDVLPKSLINLT